MHCVASFKKKKKVRTLSSGNLRPDNKAYRHVVTPIRLIKLNYVYTSLLASYPGSSPCRKSAWAVAWVRDYFIIRRWPTYRFVSTMAYIPYSGELSRRKTFVNFAVLWLFAKVFSAKFGGVASLPRHKRAIRKSFLCENSFFRQFAKVFSLEIFPQYGMLLFVN